ncbi:MAG: Cell division protein ftsA [candidate division WWE3 bacterium GW2011_GWA1_46_21]|uniref:Cell division protein FtsA n=4 Tax=Katanobacteria TaxID=422282 RepID=A0A0G1PG85_UNCKA|nr:MAG: Cell division protein ftsA [candidate division WWE3 bacterium GW2011_GWA1_46_21]KKU51168.1 MAG: Cell division protein ftsA [candidate division WWE3 bacterium GW2011_GWC1_47_10]KKU57762.1 MAG: Cell division protein ftsA [candidate division WWE3 bacterium GW2011_GWB1_47_11]
MAREKIITAIDVGSTKISTIVAALSDSKISVIGVSRVPSLGISKGNVIDIDDAVESISNSLERAERMAGISVSSALVTVSGSHIDTKNSHGVVAVSHQGAEITPDDVARVTDAAQAVTLPSTQEIIHVIPRDFVVDSQDGIRDPVGMSGIRLEVETNIIHGSSTAMRNLAKCVGQVGVEVSDLVYTALASSEAVLTDTEKELGTILLDIGGGTSAMIMFFEGSPIYSSVLPIGGKHITNDLAIGLRANMEAAEKIKVRLSDERASLSALDHGSMGGLKEDIDVSEFDLDINQVPRKLLYEIMDSRVDEIFNLVALEIKKANLVGKLPAGIVLTGGAGLTSGIERVAKSVLKMPVRVGYPKGVTGLIDEIEGPAFSAVVGSIIYGSKLVRSGPMLSFESQRGNIRSVFSKLIDKAKSFLP